MDSQEPETLTIQQVADILKLSVDAIKRRYIKDPNNPLPVIKLSRNTYRVPKKAFMDWLQSQPDPRMDI